jgi:hypothetical protein
MPKIDSWIDYKVLQNVIIWSCLFPIIAVSITAEEPILSSFFILLIFAPPIYINNFFILPKLQKGRLLFAFLFMVNALVFSFISIQAIGAYTNTATENGLLKLFGILLLALTFGSALKLTRDSFIVSRERKEAELQLLKAQLNPHFLFNTLNNLYGLSVIKSDKLPALMLKLSDLLRYSLYDTKDELVPLKKDIEYLENYVSLEQIRLEDQTEIKFTKQGALDSKYIVPMLLIVFVENAFKHLSDSKAGKSQVSVDISVVENEFNFSCINTVSGKEVITNNLEKGKSGIGLDNAGKRLELMYPGRYKLEVKREETFFEVNLKLKL